MNHSYDCRRQKTSFYAWCFCQYICIWLARMSTSQAKARFPSKRNRLPIGCSVEAVATMIGCLPTQPIAFGWKPGLRRQESGQQLCSQQLCVSQSEAYSPGGARARQGDLYSRLSATVIRHRRRRAICDRLPWLRNRPAAGRTDRAGRRPRSTNTHLITHQASGPITRSSPQPVLSDAVARARCPYRRPRSRH